ncbi:MAG: double-strand break repair helicase AddA [Bosea sp. (in: a-proteobacteria)]
MSAPANLPPVPSPATKAAQLMAADPAISSFVSANAGSGKTTVLVNRVLRLLLAGVEPSRIVCLTYTEAAAANMQIRLFRELSNWATASDDKLANNLTKLVGKIPPLSIMARARTLFAAALETPGGLSINTIHGFCTRVLQTAPFEADVPAGFKIIQGADLALLKNEAIRDCLLAGAKDPGSDLGKAMARITQDTEETRFADLIEEIITERESLRGADGAPLIKAAQSALLARALDISSDESEAQIIAAFRLRELQPERIDTIRAQLGGSSNKTDTEKAAIFAALRHAEQGADILAMLRKAFLQKDKPERYKVFLTDKLAKANPGLKDELEALFVAFETASGRLASLVAHERSLALATIAHDILARIEAGKRRMRALDFADIITRTQALFTRVSSAWVLYKLDAGIDHVLIDEAQDTSAQQWDIIKRLTGDFFAGEGARRDGLRRTVFAVGDVKQSIYSFQKAEPAAFEDSRRHFERLALGASEAGHRFERISLTQSFRSTPEIMEGVNLIFASEARHRGLVFDGASRPDIHETARQDGIGSIDLWPIEINDPKPKRRAWDPAPVDTPSAGQQKLALRIARVLQRWTAQGHDDLGRPFRPGDVLILMRRRNSLFELIVRELKRLRVPVAGVDRLDLSTHVAVDDIAAIGRTALLPEDDLTLATALKTPIFGLDDDALLRLAPLRAGSLRQAIAEKPEHASLHARLGLLEWRALHQGPFAFYARLLGPEGGRHSMLARLGPEAGDALDAVLAQALEYERAHGPSLIGFIEALGGADQIKRDLAEEAGEVRIMTVHGAKGLEAPLVIIPDLGAPAQQSSRKTLQLCKAASGNAQLFAPIWVPRKELHAPASLAASQAFDAAQDDERRRQFYVALTRARDRLILCGAAAKAEPKPESWYGMALEGLSEKLVPALHPDGGDAPILRFKLSDSSAEDVIRQQQPAIIQPANRPDWLLRPAPKTAPVEAAISPSRLARGRDGGDGPHDEPRHQSDPHRLAAGLLAHRLLQHLPNIAAAARERAARALGRLHGGAMSEELRERTIANVLALMAAPALQELFGPGSVAEAGVAGEIMLASGRRMAISGRIDRLVASKSEVLIADFKSGHAPSNVQDIRPQALAQIATYRALLAQIYPEHRIRAAIIYMDDGVMLEAPDAALDAALASITPD